MRIGEFATFNNTTIDTIRHYMDMSLLTPEKKGLFMNLMNQTKRILRQF